MNGMTRGGELRHSRIRLCLVQLDDRGLNGCGDGFSTDRKHHANKDISDLGNGLKIQLWKPKKKTAAAI